MADDRTQLNIVYYSSGSSMTARFVGKVQAGASVNIAENPGYRTTEPYLLVIPTYVSTPERVGSSVAKPVRAWLAVGEHHKLCLAVIGTGNRNFGSSFCAAGREAAHKLGVPYLGSVELMGTPEEVLWAQHAVADLRAHS